MNRKKSSPISRSATAPWARVCYGVDLSGPQPIAVCGARTGSTVKFSDVPEIGSMASANSEKRTVVAGCLSQRESFTRWVTAPFPSVAKAMQIYPSLLDIQLPFPLDDCIYNFYPASKTEEQTVPALSVAARIADIEKRLKLYSERGIDPAVLDQEGIALWTQSVREIPLPEDVQRVLICMHEERVTVVIGRTDGILSSAHNVARKATDIDRVLKAEFPNGVKKLQWAWTGPGLEGDRHAGIDTIDDISDRWPGESVTHDEPRTFLARGLATRALLGGPIRCNLRSGELEHERVTAHLQNHVRKSLVMLAAAGLVACCLAGGADMLSEKKMKAALRTHEDRVNALAGITLNHKGRDAWDALDPMLKKRKQKAAPFLKSFDKSPTVILGTMLQTASEQSLSYNRIVIRDDSLTAGGAADKWEACEVLLGQIQEAGYSVRLGRQSSTDGRIFFTLSPEKKRR